jgi:hypothetical protein
MQKVDAVAGKKEVIELLEKYLEEVRDAPDVHFGGVFYVCSDKRFSADYAGDLKGFFGGFYALDHLMQRMRRMTNIDPVENVSEGPANKFVYDMIDDPICHDFLIWLVTAKMIMRREGAKPPLKIAFARKYEMKEREQNFFKNVMLPALDMFGAVHDHVAFEGRRLPVFTPRLLVEASRSGEEVPRVMVSLDAVDAVRNRFGDVAPVVITLREETIYDHRNSNLDAWCQFGSWLEARGERVVFLRDTAKAKEWLISHWSMLHETMWEASVSAYVRVALYENAKCNMFVSNGPLGWALLGTKPFLAFHTVTESESSECNTPAWWIRNHGIGPGEQYPWSSPQQRIVYADDSFENLCAAWLDLFPDSKECAA